MSGTVTTGASISLDTEAYFLQPVAKSPALSPFTNKRDHGYHITPLAAQPLSFLFKKIYFQRNIGTLF
jgi:hypothetical protein